MVRIMEQRTDVGILGPQLLNPDGSVQPSCFQSYPSLLTTFFGHSWIHPLLDYLMPNVAYPGRFYETPSKHEMMHEPKHLLGACLMVRRRALEDIGFMDERFFLYREDTDLCKRVSDAGWRILYFPKAKVVHYGGRSGAQIGGTAQYLHLISEYLYHEKHHGKLSAELLRVIRLFASLLGIVWLSILFILSLKRRRDFIKMLISRSLYTIKLHVGGYA